MLWRGKDDTEFLAEALCLVENKKGTFATATVRAVSELKRTERALARESAITSAIARLFTSFVAPTTTFECIALLY